jgi:Ca2+-transporting ATPase
VAGVNPSNPDVVFRPWAREVAEVAAALETDPSRGLTADEAAARLIRFGRNELVERGKKPLWRLLLEQFTNAMIVVLVVAAVITALLGDLKDTFVILAIVVLNGIVGFVQEYRAEQALDALKRMGSPTARVVRDGETLLVPAPEVVPGDLVRLDAGDVVIADLRLVDARALRVNEAALTGESEPAEKSIESLPDVPKGILADQRNVAFNGTAVVYGRGLGIAVTTGMSTALGRVAELLQENAGGQTPLQKRLSTLGKALAGLTFVVCAMVFAAGVARGESPHVMFLVAVSLAVAAIPEGLPAVVTVALALGARRMARRNALVRKLPAVETLGSVSVICSDKTGTLTENRMLVERVWTPAGTFGSRARGPSRPWHPSSTRLTPLSSRPPWPPPAATPPMGTASWPSPSGRSPPSQTSPGSRRRICGSSASSPWPTRPERPLRTRSPPAGPPG